MIFLKAKIRPLVPPGEYSRLLANPKVEIKGDFLYYYLTKGDVIELEELSSLITNGGFKVIARDRRESFVHGYSLIYFRTSPFSILFPEIEKDEIGVAWEVRNLNLETPVYSIFAHVSRSIGITRIRQSQGKIYYEIIQKRITFPENEEQEKIFQNILDEKEIKTVLGQVNNTLTLLRKKCKKLEQVLSKIEDGN